MYLAVGDWANVIGAEYLDSFIRDGGATVKFVVPNGVSSDVVHAALAREAQTRSYHYALLDSGKVRVNAVDLLWFGLAKTIDWDGLSKEFVATVVQSQGANISRCPTSILLEDIAHALDRSPATLEGDVKRWLDKAIYLDHNMSAEFRWALFHLCWFQVAGQTNQVDEIIRWLQGITKTTDALRSIGIRQPITRNISRHLVYSLAYWLTKAGKTGLVLGLDLAALAVEKRPKEPDGVFYYGPSAKLDAHEVLRQFVDAADELRHCLVYVTVPASVLTHEKYGIAAYKALKMRIWDEVRDTQRANPMSALVRVEERQPILALERQHLLGRKITYQRAIEALRAGVPSRDAVMELGIPAKYRDPYVAALARIQEHPGHSAHESLLVVGDFGSGKSHTLESYRHTALDENMICSGVVASKETPLFDWEKLYRAIIESARVPGKTGAVMTVLAESLKPRSIEFEQLMAYVSKPSNGFLDIFPATLTLFETATRELKEWIVKFWEGGYPNLGQFRPALKAINRKNQFQLVVNDKALLAQQRLQFATALARAVGYEGWVVLVDEVELIGRYSLHQRARSYAVVSKLVGKSRGYACPGMVSVLACTEDFESAVLEGKGDLLKLPEKMPTVKSLCALVHDAGVGMGWLRHPGVRLTTPSGQSIDVTYSQVKRMHGFAYNWEPPEAPRSSRTTTLMRHHVRSWITSWDLRRMDPLYESRVEIQKMDLGYDENPDLEKPDEGQEDLGMRE